MNDNLRIYNFCADVPENAKKPIKGGRLAGMTDINPMWRIKELTEMFGPCGIGWNYIIKDKMLAPAHDGEIAAFVDIDLIYKENDIWSEPIPGTGGNMFVVKESKGLRTNDDCFKSALTDAISVAAKAIGLGGSVYWEKDKTKYGKQGDAADKEDKKAARDIKKEDDAWREAEKELLDYAQSIGVLPNVVQEMFPQKYEVQFFAATADQLKQAKKDMEAKHAKVKTK